MFSIPLAVACRTKLRKSSARFPARTSPPVYVAAKEGTAKVEKKSEIAPEFAAGRSHSPFVNNKQKDRSKGQAGLW